jgi:hypothetical protein
MDETDILSDLPVRAFFGLLEADQIPWLPCEDGLFADDDIALAVLCRLLDRLAATGLMPPVARPLLWSLLLRPRMDAVLRDRFTVAALGPAWRTISETLPEPARSRCADYASLSDASAR